MIDRVVRDFRFLPNPQIPNTAGQQLLVDVLETGQRYKVVNNGQAWIALSPVHRGTFETLPDPANAPVGAEAFVTNVGNAVCKPGSGFAATGCRMLSNGSAWLFSGWTQILEFFGSPSSATWDVVNPAASTTVPFGCPAPTLPAKLWTPGRAYKLEFVVQRPSGTTASAQIVQEIIVGGTSTGGAITGGLILAASGWNLANSTENDLPTIEGFVAPGGTTAIGKAKEGAGNVAVSSQWAETSALSDLSTAAQSFRVAIQNAAGSAFTSTFRLILVRLMMRN